MLSRLELLKKAKQLAHKMVDDNSTLSDTEYTELKAKYPNHPEVAIEILAVRIIDEIGGVME